MSAAIRKTARGFHVYGEPVVCTYGSTVAVRESSSAEGPRVWLDIDSSEWDGSGGRHGSSAAHLTGAQARAVIERLQAWLDEIPSRWVPEDK